MKNEKELLKIVLIEAIESDFKKLAKINTEIRILEKGKGLKDIQNQTLGGVFQNV